MILGQLDFTILAILTKKELVKIDIPRDEKTINLLEKQVDMLINEIKRLVNLVK